MSEDRARERFWTNGQSREYALQLRDQYKNDPPAKEAGSLVSEYFSSQERIGMIRLMESPYYRPELQNEEFMSALQEMFPLRKF